MQHLGQERRKTLRTRSYLGGRVVFNHHASTMDCLVRNVSPSGAKLVFSGTALLPDRFEVYVARKDTTYAARIVWRTGDEAGVAFEDAPASNVISLETARQLRQLRQLEAERATLGRRLAEIGEPA